MGQEDTTQEKGGRARENLSGLVKKSLEGSHRQLEEIRRTHKIHKRTEDPSHQQDPPILVFDEIHEAISTIRDSMVRNLFSIDSSTDSVDPYIFLANSCRNAMVKILDCNREEVHCTVKLCSKDKKKPVRNTKLWTFARSNERKGRSLILGPTKKIAVYKNSSFSSIIGCKDSKKNNWEFRPNLCFSCNDLSRFRNYADSKKAWPSFYNSAVVFPLRYSSDSRRPWEHFLGFLTFDSLRTDLFTDVPFRFEYFGRPDEYLTELRKTDVYHVGQALADVLTACMVLARKIKDHDILDIAEV